MTKFVDPNERRKEMAYYTYNEFKKFVSNELELGWKCVFEIYTFVDYAKENLKV